MSRKNIFDLSGVNIKTTRNDHVLRTIDDVDESVLIASGKITRVKPAMTKRLSSLVRFVVIAQHHQGPTHTDFAHFTDWYLFALIIEKP